MRKVGGVVSVEEEKKITRNILRNMKMKRRKE